MLNTNEYNATLLGDNIYQIDTTFNDEPISFKVVVAQDESEVDELVQFRMNELANPPVFEEQKTSPSFDLQSVVQEQQVLIEQLTARLNALEEK
jgi:hypothetical protein